MKNRRATVLSVAVAAILISPISLKAESPQAQPTIIISVTAPPGLSVLITNSASYTTAWSQSKPYTSVSIAVLVNSAIVGQTPTADAYLTTRIGPGTTTMDEIAHTRFAVPAVLPVCSPYSCAATVTLFSGLSLGPGTYFVTMGPAPASSGVVGWFPTLSQGTVILDTGVSQGTSSLAFGSEVASYPPASAFGPFTVTISPPFPPVTVDAAMNITVTGTVAFTGEPGRPNCYGESVSALARQFGGLDAAASALGFRSVRALQDAISAFCGG